LRGKFALSFVYNLKSHKEMAKKVVATLRDKTVGKNFAKVIKAVKSPKTGAYTFKEEMVPMEELQNALK
jgi:hypothetical protein